MRLAVLTTALWATTALGQPVETAVIVPDSGDTGFVLLTAIGALLTLVPGILLYFAGRLGRNHMAQMLSVVAVTLALGIMLFFGVGYSLSFDLAGSSWLGGASHWMLNLMGTVREDTTIAETAFVLFQWVGAAGAVTLLAAILAPRARTSWLLGFIALWALLVLVPVMRWLPGGGWLSSMAAVDAAGGLWIFYCGGVSALIALIMVGAVPDEASDAPDDTLALGGAMLLVPGVALLAAGATLGAGDDAAVAVINVVAAAAAGMLALAALSRAIGPRVLATGIVAGTVGAAAGGDALSLGGAVLTGVLCALSAWLTPRLMPRRFSWQDSGHSVATMTGAAKTGAFLVAFFIAFTPFGGSGYADGVGMGQQVVAQLVAILAVAGWSVIGTTIAGLMVSLIAPMRGASK